MAPVTAKALSPEICSRIVRWTRRSDLAALCLTCKPLQREAEAKLYEVIMSGNIQITFRACQSIVSQPRLGLYVRSFYVFQDSRRGQREISEQFWGTMQLALSKMRSLEYLLIHDPVFTNSWVLGDIAHIPFQLLEARLNFYWDVHLVKFLESQNKLKSLHTIDGPDDSTSLQLEAGSLPELRIFDGPLVAVQYIVPIAMTLTHLQVVLDTDSRVDLLTFIPTLSHVASSLRALSILHLPEGQAMEVFRSIASTCPHLRHIGTIPLPLPAQNSNRFHRALMAMHQLRMLEVDVTSWTPQPTGMLQRGLAAEIRIYCPSIEHICFWAGAGRTLWAIDGNDWSYHSESGQHSQLDGLWKTR
ncbi:hypothetical protein HYDPIDRAFT_99133 [Hydnomerulius pinastri MD-312]|uniref:F-box domain-containing protein n=1 Tax=Hydnomerulius pinastri MD-312 TaxID=994086 RepID=A0A0C9WAR0_9AGAM|nr:hypothetical protein HYDPIDRAFT_99133 [Hydnomerulius pinastri MD-312]